MISLNKDVYRIRYNECRKSHESVNALKFTGTNFTLEGVYNTSTHWNREMCRVHIVVPQRQLLVMQVDIPGPVDNEEDDFSIEVDYYLSIISLLGNVRCLRCQQICCRLS